MVFDSEPENLVERVHRIERIERFDEDTVMVSYVSAMYESPEDSKPYKWGENGETVEAVKIPAEVVPDAGEPGSVKEYINENHL